jgi:lysophospholipase L1-like esterase
LRARAVVLAVGDNDLRRGCDESDIVGNYRAILAQIPQNVAIFFCSLTPCSESADAGRMNEKIGKLNRLGAEVCATRPDCYYVDLNSILANEAGCLRTQFADADGVHLNGMGYRVCIEKLRESLAKHASVAAAKAHNVID